MQVNPEDSPPDIYVTWSNPRMTDFENWQSVYTDNFSAFEWIRKNKKHQKKSIGFLFKFAKINRRKNIQINGNSHCHLSRTHHSILPNAGSGAGDSGGFSANQSEMSRWKYL